MISSKKVPWVITEGGVLAVFAQLRVVDFKKYVTSRATWPDSA
jgi:hypothetical protein